MSSIGRTTNNVETAPGQKRGGSVGQKLRGATEVVHGLGDNLRGHFMDALDSSTNTGKAQHPETHQGRREVESGMAKLTGGPGAATAMSAGSGKRDSWQSHYQPNPEYGDAPLAQEGNTLGPSSAMSAGFGNGGPETAVAEVPYQQQYSAGGRGAPESGAGFGGSNNRDFATRQQGSETGPVPDRYELGGEPKQLA